MEKYTPQIVEETPYHVYVTFLLELDRCPECSIPMMSRGQVFARYCRQDHLFPKYMMITGAKQVEAAGFRYKSSMLNKRNKCICEQCAEAGKSTFVCCICKREYPTGEEQDSIGYPPDHTCKHCYETVPAKVYMKTIEGLEESHKYDGCS
jgi:hypothetical protein